MPSLTNNATFTFGPASPQVEEVAIEIMALPVGPAPTGHGRLVHPTLGTLDYDYTPTNWTNIDADLIVAPVWATSKTLRGSANTLWRGDVRDVVCVERWDSDAGGLKMRMETLRMLIAFFVNPPDPANATVQWWPNYTSDQGFKVAITNLTVGGQGVTLDTLATRKGWARRDVELTLKILGRV